MKHLFIGVVSISSPIFAKWINPSEDICVKNGGRILSTKECQAKWSDANEICKVSKSRLPDANELYSIVEECGGKNKTSIENLTNKAYFNCFVKRGFKPNAYWTSTQDEEEKDNAYSITFLYGTKTSKEKNKPIPFHCIKD